MSNLIDIQNQIESLTKQANAIRLKEFDKTVAEIRAKMLAFGISIKDLRMGTSGKSTQKSRKVKITKGKRAPSGAAMGPQVATPAPVKFRGPNGETWSGRGLTPRWLAALVAGGNTKEDYLIKS